MQRVIAGDGRRLTGELAGARNTSTYAIHSTKSDNVYCRVIKMLVCMPSENLALLGTILMGGLFFSAGGSVLSFNHPQAFPDPPDFHRLCYS